MSDEICVNPEVQSSLNRASKDRLVLLISLPPALRKLAITDDCLNIDFLQLGVYGALVPTIVVPAVEVRYGSQSVNYSSHARPNYPPLSVNFMVDNEFKNYYILWKWLALMNDPIDADYNGTSSTKQTSQAQTELGMLNEYQTNLTLQALNEFNKPTVEWVYRNSFITSLGGISYSYREGENIETTAEFQYSQLEMVRQFA